jgi:DNA invertase Pin-like site-specific DNA recombinase
VDQAKLNWHNRAQFLAVAAQLMRHILVDHARGLCRGKRGGGTRVLPGKARVVELRYFGGMSVEETAEVLRVHPTTVKNDWRMAKMWLKHELTPKDTDGG